MNIFGYGDIERWIIIGLLSISLYLLWSANFYDKGLKILLTIPRVYILLFELAVILDIYTANADLTTLVKSGITTVYGLMLLFSVEVYARWVCKKYKVKV